MTPQPPAAQSPPPTAQPRLASMKVMSLMFALVPETCGLQAPPPFVVTRMAPGQPAAQPRLASMKVTLCRSAAVPEDCANQPALDATAKAPATSAKLTVSRISAKLRSHLRMLRRLAGLPVGTLDCLITCPLVWARRRAPRRLSEPRGATVTRGAASPQRKACAAHAPPRSAGKSSALRALFYSAVSTRRGNCGVRAASKTPQEARRRPPYRFTVKLTALLVPAVVLTVTFTAPYLAAAGTLHLICVALQET